MAKKTSKEVPLKDRPPRFVYAGKPEFTNDREEELWWAEEKRRWKEGYDGLTGKHYFHLTQCWISSGTEGELIRPIWREVDEFIFQCIDEAERKRYDLYIIKPRGVGLTTIGAGTLPFYYIYTTKGNCTIGFTSCDLPRINKAANDKTFVTLENFDEAIRPLKYRENNTKTLTYLQLHLNKRDPKTGVVNKYKGEIYAAETSSNPSAFSVARMKFIFIDEFALHKKRKEVLTSSEDTLNESGIRTGFRLLGGTVEEGIKQEDLEVIRSIVHENRENPEASRMVVCFIPDYMNMTHYEDPETKEVKEVEGTQNGWFNKEEATKINLHIRAELDRLSDKSKLRAYIKNHPLSLEDVLEGSGEGRLPAELAERIDTQGRKLLREPPPVFRYDITTDEKGNYIATQNDKGVFVILEMPHSGIITKDEYIAANDCIPYGDADVSDGSQDCVLIKRRSSQKYVAYYMERNMDADYTTQNKIKLLRFYHNCRMMLEMNRGEVTYAKFQDYGAFNLLAPKPVMLGITYTTSRKIGIFKNKFTSVGNELLFKYLYNHTEKIDFQVMIDQLKGFGIGNKDMNDTMLWVECFDEELRRRKNRMQTEEIETEYTNSLVWENGNKVWKRVPVNYYKKGFVSNWMVDGD